MLGSDVLTIMLFKNISGVKTISYGSLFALLDTFI